MYLVNRVLATYLCTESKTFKFRLRNLEYKHLQETVITPIWRGNGTQPAKMSMITPAYSERQSVHNRNLHNSTFPVLYQMVHNIPEFICDTTNSR